MPNAKRTFHRIACIVSVAVLSFGFSLCLAQAQENPKPETLVENFHNVLLDAAKAGETWSLAQRGDHLRPKIEHAFNLKLMLHVTGGRLFQTAKKSEQAGLLQAFTEMTVRTYATRFKRDAGQQFEMLGTRPGPQKTTLVETQIRAEGDTHKLTYVLRKDHDGTWKIIDILLGDSAISQLAVQRSEFAATLKSGGIPALISALDAKP